MRDSMIVSVVFELFHFHFEKGGVQLVSLLIQASTHPSFTLSLLSNSCRLWVVRFSSPYWK